LKLVFAGTPEFAAQALDQLIAAGHELVLVLTQPDRPAGRGMKLQASPVKQRALSKGIAVAQPRSLRLDGKYPQDARDAQQMLMTLQADAMVVAAYGLILPQWVLDLHAGVSLDAANGAARMKWGCFNIHGSLLPRWRGAAPIHRAIEAGDAETGITIMQMDAGLDTGDMLLRESVPILPTDTTGSLHDRLAALGGALMVQALNWVEQDGLTPERQPPEGVTYASKIDKSEAVIDWSQSAQTLVRRVRAFNPFPGASTWYQGELLKIWGAEVSDVPLAMGQTVGQIVGLSDVAIGVAAADGVVNLTAVQRPGGKRLSVAQFLHGNAVQLGQVLT